MNNYKYIGKNIKSLRERFNLSQRELSDRLEISSAYLSAVETGNKKPSLNLILSIAKNLNIDPAEVITTDSSYFEIRKVFKANNVEEQVKKFSRLISSLAQSE